MTALSNAKTYLATLKDDGRTRYDGHPDVLLSELVAEIEAAPVGVVSYGTSNERGDPSRILHTQGSAGMSLNPGTTVRLLVLDSGGAVEGGGK
ncbi:MAG: hypothetical protein ACTS5I_06825 [Rhodanobacter sp.]